LPPGSAVLNICGDESADPGYAAQLKTEAADLPVTFWGQLDRAGLAARMAESDVLAVPSLWPEAFSLIALEARAAGLPLLVSDIGALCERVQSADDGWRVPPGDVGAWARAVQAVSDSMLPTRVTHQLCTIKTDVAYTSEITREYETVANSTYRR
jgi:glycogen(starch) synthase